ncbi:histidine kinase [Edaphobacter sp. HDX4]|uniref:sensor histidine kinase n=1 Tax=Edaphobacter sp. HDX4 TaxID=2794064 RepID=UPI002FE52AB1
MHPLIFIAAATSLGMLFALQEWIGSRFWNYHVDLSLLLEAWGAQYFLWGVLCWILWWTLRSRINTANLKTILIVFFPLSILTSVLEETIWVLLFPRLPMGRPPMPFWQRLSFHLDAELIDSLVLFWCAFFLFRGLGYYQRYREKERIASQLQSQLVQAQMRALRMQLNPHFLFNTMNGISSLMRIDVAAADLMLEQLSRLLRITLHRGESQFIPLSDEMEFIEMYLAMQDRRFAGRVLQQTTIDPHVHDAIVPTMILQPIVENAYAHGLSRLSADGVLSIDASSEGSFLRLSVTNTGLGLRAAQSTSGNGVGLVNVQDRLRMHYGNDHTFSMSELEGNLVQVVITLPLRFSERPTEQTTGYGA